MFPAHSRDSVWGSRHIDREAVRFAPANHRIDDGIPSKAVWGSGKRVCGEGGIQTASVNSVHAKGASSYGLIFLKPKNYLRNNSSSKKRVVSCSNWPKTSGTEQEERGRCLLLLSYCPKAEWEGRAIKKWQMWKAQVPRTSREPLGMHGAVFCHSEGKHCLHVEWEWGHWQEAAHRTQIRPLSSR